MIMRTKDLRSLFSLIDGYALFYSFWGLIGKYS